MTTTTNTRTDSLATLLQACLRPDMLTWHDVSADTTTYGFDYPAQATRAARAIISLRDDMFAARIADAYVSGRFVTVHWND